MIVVSNSSPLIVLTKIGHLDLLAKLYGTITITPQVQAEVVRAGQGLPGAAEVSTASWIIVRPVDSIAKLKDIQSNLGLGIGEASAIVLAKELRANVILLDDRKARRAAREEDLTALGSVGVLESAFGLRLIADLAAVYRRLLDVGAYVSLDILQDSRKAHNLPKL